MTLSARCLAVLGLASLALSSGACRREPEAPPLIIDARAKAPSAASVATAPPAAPAPAIAQAAAPAPAATTAAPANTAAAEPGGDAAVEIMGAVQIPPGPPPRGKLVAMIAQGDCLDPSAKILRRVPITDEGSFFTVVLVPPASSLTVCAAAEAAPGRPATVYGKAEKPLPVGDKAAQEFRDVGVVLTAGPPRLFPPSPPR